MYHTEYNETKEDIKKRIGSRAFAFLFSLVELVKSMLVIIDEAITKPDMVRYGNWNFVTIFVTIYVLQEYNISTGIYMI